LTDIPAEIFLTIFDILKWNEDMLPEHKWSAFHNLSLVCCWFYTVMQPVLFDSIRIVQDGRIGKLSKARTRASRSRAFQSALLNNDVELRTVLQHTHACTLLDETDWKLHRVAKLQYPTKVLLKKLPSLTTLTLCQVVIDSSLLSLLLEIPMLDSVYFGNTYFRGLTAADARSFSRARWKTLSWSDHYTEYDIHRTETLDQTVKNILGCKMHTFWTDNSILAQSLLSGHGHSLVTLKLIKVEGLETLAKFLSLRSTSSLRELSILAVQIRKHSNSVPPLNYATASLSNLNSVTCPAFLIEWFTNLENLTDISLLGWVIHNCPDSICKPGRELGRAITSILLRCGHKLKTLEIPTSLLGAVPSELMPRMTALKTLQIDFVHPNFTQHVSSYNDVSVGMFSVAITDSSNRSTPSFEASSPLWLLTFVISSCDVILGLMDLCKRNPWSWQKRSVCFNFRIVQTW
jgi:hypothetical protein